MIKITKKILQEVYPKRRPQAHKIDIISDGKQVALNKTGNPYMTKAGTGDTLAGICGALLAQGQDAFKAACAAAYINGQAGDIAAAKLKQSLMASDLIEAIFRCF